MCGIWLVSYGPDGPGAEEWTPAEFASIFFPAIVHRGPHAYGWMYYDGTDIVVQKYKGRADTKRALARMADIPDNVQWIVGHVRYATNGSPNQMVNNHPIVHDKIIGVHNGVLRNYREILAQTGRHDDTAEVDSEAIFAAVNKWGHKAGLNRIAGDMVAVYVNKEFPQSLNVARLHGRPFEICTTPTGAWMGASEQRVIDAAGIEHNQFSPLSTYRLLRVKMGRVLERANLNPQAPAPPARVNWSYQGLTDQMTPDKPRRAPKYPAGRVPVGDAGIKPDLSNPRWSSTGQNLKEGQRWGGWIMHNNQLISMQEYAAMIDKQIDALTNDTPDQTPGA